MLADLRGTLDGIVGVAEVAADKHAGAASSLEALRGLADRLRKPLAAARDAHALARRAELIALTGELGVAARRLAQALGVTPKLPYLARRPVKDNTIDEPIHALVIPAPRIDPRAGDRAAMVALGKRLFSDPRLSKQNKRACSDCHLADHAFGGDTPVPTSLDRQPIARNTPPLAYTSLHAAQLWDGRFASAERQAIRVIHASGEMGLEPGELGKIVASDEALAAAFRQAFGRDAGDDDVARALVAYEIDAFVPAQSPVDRFARGEGEALSAGMHEGFDLFVGKGRCARCHIPPLFGGSRPPDFSIAVYAVLGVPTAPGSETLDDDPGRGAVTKNALDQHAFKTPTVRNAAVTAPFFHHGAFPSLEAVVDFYADGGGRGLGLSVENQDPDVRKLDLDEGEKKSLLHFMREALRDP